MGEHPLVFTFLSMALCGALCYTENSSTGKLEFMNRVAQRGSNCGSVVFLVWDLGDQALGIRNLDIVGKPINQLI